MRVRAIVFGSLLVACPSSRDEGLPALPDDLVTALGSERDAVARQHALPMPTVAEPFATSEEHRAWVAAELDPWRASLHEVATRVRKAEPEPPSDAPPAVATAWARKTFVHTMLTATLVLDESIARVRIQLPRDTPPKKATVYMLRFLAQEHGTADAWRRRCTEYATGSEPMPADLEPWAHHCTALCDTLVESICAAEFHAALPPSIPCSGTRALLPPKAPAPGPETAIAD